MNQWINFLADPMDIFDQWYGAALEVTSFEPTKTTLATVGEDGFPSSRVVLLKEYNTKGFNFFTNYESRKAQEIAKTAKAALVFHWEKPKHRQVRVQGVVEKLTYEESNNYFQSRNRGSQIGAWASPQSAEITGRAELEKRVATMEDRFLGKDVPCPENWGGYRVTPLMIEFWEAGENRLHDRAQFSRLDINSPWTSHRLAP